MEHARHHATADLNFRSYPVLLSLSLWLKHWNLSLLRSRVGCISAIERRHQCRLHTHYSDDLLQYTPLQFCSYWNGQVFHKIKSVPRDHCFLRCESLCNNQYYLPLSSEMQLLDCQTFIAMCTSCIINSLSLHMLWASCGLSATRHLQGQYITSNCHPLHIHVWANVSIQWGYRYVV